MVKPSTSQPSPLSPTHWSPEAFAWWRSLLAIVAVLAAFGVGAVLDGILVYSSRIDLHRGLHLTWGIALGQMVNYLPIVGVLVALLPWLARRSLADLGLRRYDRSALRAALIGAVAMYAATLLAAGLQYAVTRAEPQEAAVELFRSTHDPLLLAVFSVLAIALAPFVEELVFRGLLFNALLRYAPAWAAALLSGIAFGFSHGSPSAAAPLAASGVVLAYVYYRSGSLAASMLTHALFNTVNVIALALGKA